MPNNQIVTVYADRVPRELVDLIGRTYKEKPDKSDLAELRKVLRDKPELYTAVFDIAEVVRNKIIEDFVGQEAAREGVKANIEATRRELETGHTSPLEKLLIEQVLVCKLHLDLWTYKYTVFANSGDMSLTQGDFWERRLSMAQKRYLRACETFAQVHKLARKDPALQVNIAAQGGQQVNLTGDLITKPKGEQR